MYNIYKTEDLNSMEFHYPLTWVLPLPMRPLQISVHFCEKVRIDYRNDYMKPFPTGSFAKKK